MKRKIIKINEKRCNGCGLYTITEEAVKESGKKIPIIQEIIGINGGIQ